MRRSLFAALEPEGGSAFSTQAGAGPVPRSLRTASARAGVLWMMGATGLFVCQDSTARILLRTYPATEIAFVRFLVHAILVGLFILSYDPRLALSRKPLLQLLRSAFLLGATLFGMLALTVMPFVDFSAVTWVAPVLVTALSVVVLHEKAGWREWASVLAGLTGVWVVLGRTGLHLSLAMVFPCLAALSNALYQIATRLLHQSDSMLTTLLYTALAGVLFCGAFLPFAAIKPNATDLVLMLSLGVIGVVSHFCLIRAFRAAPASIIAPFGYTSLLWATLASLTIFFEVPGPRTLFGAALIAGAGIFIVTRRPAV